MAKGQMRGNKEKKKPKQDKNKKNALASPVPVRQYAQPGEAGYEPLREEVLDCWVAGRIPAGRRATARRPVDRFFKGLDF